MLQQRPQLRDKVVALIEEYVDVFSSPDRVFGKTTLLEFDVELKPGSKPHKAKCRPLNPKQKD